MSTLEKYTRLFADIIAGIIGEVYFDSSKNNAPMWAVFFMIFIGLISIMLLSLAVYAQFFA